MTIPGNKLIAINKTETLAGAPSGSNRCPLYSEHYHHLGRGGDEEWRDGVIVQVDYNSLEFTLLSTPLQMEHLLALSKRSMEKEKYANCRGAKLMEVVAVEVNEGDGTPDDPIKRVLYLYSKDGKLLAQTKDQERKFKENDFIII